MSKKNPRVHRETLPGKLSDALLNVPFEAEAESRPEGHASVGQRLQAAKDELAAAVAASNKVLSANALTSIIAEHAAREAGRRGTPTVVVDDNGDVMLEVHYLPPGAKLPTAPEPKVKLPPISELRREAELLGIDWQPFGKGKKALIKAIDQAKAGGQANTTPDPPKTTPDPPVSAPKPKRQKTAPSITPPKQVKLDGRKVIPLADDDDDLGGLFDDDPPPAKPEPAPKPKRKAPRRGTPAPKTPAPKRGGRSLSAIAEGADDEVDIDAILAKPAPPIPNED